MRNKLIVLLCLFAILAVVAPVLAVTNGQPDGNGHPYVGMVIQPIPSMPGFVEVCSGTALSPTVFLTAAHCADPSRPVFVSYKSGPLFDVANDFTPGTFHPNPNWCLGCEHAVPDKDFHDVAVVTLDSPVNPGSFGALPAAGLVDTPPMGTAVDLVGYGVVGFVELGAILPGRAQVFRSTRYFAPTMLVPSNNVLSAEIIKLQANPSQGTGGVCFGDSGGPDLLGGTNTILAVNSYVIKNTCVGVTYSTRVDLPDILAFINGFLH